MPERLGISQVLQAIDTGSPTRCAPAKCSLYIEEGKHCRLMPPDKTVKFNALCVFGWSKKETEILVLSNPPERGIDPENTKRRFGFPGVE